MTTREQINKQLAYNLLELDDDSRKAFSDRLDKLLGSPRWPVANWYNDEDFAQAFATACFWKDKFDRICEYVELDAICPHCGETLECDPDCAEEPDERMLRAREALR